MSLWASIRFRSAWIRAVIWIVRTAVIFGCLSRFVFENAVKVSDGWKSAFHCYLCHVLIGVFQQLAGELYAVFVDKRGEIHVEIPVEEREKVAVIVAET